MDLRTCVVGGSAADCHDPKQAFLQLHTALLQERSQAFKSQALMGVQICVQNADGISKKKKKNMMIFTGFSQTSCGLQCSA